MYEYIGSIMYLIPIRQKPSVNNTVLSIHLLMDYVRSEIPVDKWNSNWKFYHCCRYFWYSFSGLKKVLISSLPIQSTHSFSSEIIIGKTIRTEIVFFELNLIFNRFRWSLQFDLSYIGLNYYLYNLLLFY